ncbi:MAG: methylenetetrahydrofolate reductase C-terminal domain-containing protein [Kiritimatiellae bacterium]|nr:methylenetetrahydrofolate reductase C-terminal domain-containing protein [Kiritimatiellia bacterium]MDD5519840.1 methylenetetrahydrofolate reductase C-terminal domain-containing protein [Kiritimatiellia bacterium]
MDNRFRLSLMDPNRMSVTWELIPGRGAREKMIESSLAAAELAAKGGKIDAVTLTDNPGGNPAMLADYLGQEILRMGIEPLVHFTCKDRNRNQMEGQLYALDRAKVRNLLVMTGDYPVTGYLGRPAPVFDLDPINVLKLIMEMNAGLTYPGLKGMVKHEPSHFYAGAAVSPFKATEAEQMVQYFKLKKKIAAGAQFVVSQLGYDARKFHELIMFMKQNGLNVPVMGNIYILTYGVAKQMNLNKLPGCVVTDKLLAEYEKEKTLPDKGVEARLLRAAKMYAFMKGMGFNGVHIGGHGVKYEQVLQVIEKGEELSSRWQEFIPEFDYAMPNGFYLYEKDEKTGLNKETMVDLKNRPLDDSVGFVYRMSRVMHRLMFEPGKNLFGMMRAWCRKADGSRGEEAFHKMEHLPKVLLYDCRDCGDCSLTDVAYSCPMSQCPKYQRNGACGGSRDGWCEVHPGKRKCVYVKAYSRLKYYGEEKSLDSYVVPPCNWDFFQTSSWINFYLGRDHSAERFGIKKPEEPKKL